MFYSILFIKCGVESGAKEWTDVIVCVFFFFFSEQVLCDCDSLTLQLCMVILV